MNSKIEEISDPCQPNILNMPKVVMEEVLRNLDCPSIFRLRKVCHDLRFSIDTIRPDLHLNSIRLELPLTERLVEEYWGKKYESQEELFMNYGEPKIACLLEWKQGDVYKQSRIPMEEAETLLKNTKLILDCLNIDLLFTSECPTGLSKMMATVTGTKDDLQKYHESLKSLLRNEDHLLRTRKIRFHVHDPSEAKEFLKFIDPKLLKTIRIRARNWHSREANILNFPELETLEQWKNAEELEIKGHFFLPSVANFASFKSMTVSIDRSRERFQIDKLNAFKELFVSSPEMRIFIIELCDVNVEELKNEMVSYFGELDRDDEPFTWIEDVPGSTEKLRITFNVDSRNFIKLAKVF